MLSADTTLTDLMAQLRDMDARNRCAILDRLPFSQRRLAETMIGEQQSDDTERYAADIADCIVGNSRMTAMTDAGRRALDTILALNSAPAESTRQSTGESLLDVLARVLKRRI